jgi:hypothetical protein
MLTRAVWARNRTFLIVIGALLLLLLLTGVLFTMFGAGDGGIEIGPIQTR